MAFVHLHVHSQYSLLDGTMDPVEIARRAAELGQSAIALTDTNNLYGAVPFFKACKDNGVRPIIGAELHVQPEGVAHEDAARVQGGYQIRALVEDEVGYRNLCALITAAIYEGMSYKPRVDLALLARHADGLIFLTGGRKGAFARGPRRADEDRALRDVVALRDAVGAGRLFLELQDHGLEGEAALNVRARAFSAALGVPTVVTNAVHYATSLDASAHEVLNAIAQGASLSSEGRVVAPTDQAYLKSEDEMAAVFPDDADAIARTAELAARCHFAFTFAKVAADYHFPATTPPDLGPAGEQLDTDANWAYFYRAFPPPRAFGFPAPEVAIPPRPEGAGSIDGFMRWYAREGLRVRLAAEVDPDAAAYDARLAFELDVIEGMGFQAYFLIVAEFINWSKDHDIPVGPGRGSAAGSLVAWAMGITDIDPIRFDLLFERFLNPERVSMPDIDVDFCQDRREEAIEHVRQKYGAALVSQIITYGKLKAKAAVRDVARVLDLKFNDADRIAKLIPDALDTTLTSALEDSEQLRRLYDGDAKVRRVLEIAKRVEGLCRQTGVHAAGVVIADQPLVHYAPLYRDGPEGGPVVQYDMKSAELVGLIKFDFLGLKTLDQIRDAVAMIAVNRDVRLDMARIPTDDPATYELLQAGDALGVFQLESSGMRELLGRLKPNLLDDLVALVALYRPGPLNSGMVNDFVDRKHGRQEVSYPHPSLEKILRPTYGTIVYQEQVMQVAQVLSGYSLGEADLLRRAMGKKKKEEMDQQKARFMRGAIDNGVDAALADEIFELLAKFADYGFNKSHSAAYGYVAYQTAWLKANYRPEYMAALMTIEAANTDKVLTYIQDCRAAGIPVLPVCLNESEAAFNVPRTSVEAGSPFIRFGLDAVKNVGSGSVRAILEARGDKPFLDALDVFERVDLRALNKRVLENLVKAGAFDFTGTPRAVLFASLDRLLSEARRRRADREAGQGMLFGGFAAQGAQELRRDVALEDVAPWTPTEELAYEKEVLGLYLSGHPMARMHDDVRRYGSVALHGLADVGEQQEVRVVGFVAGVRMLKTHRGDRMAKVALEDDRAVVEAMFFPEAWTRSQAALRAGGTVLVSGKVEQGESGPTMRGNTAEPLEEVRARSVKEVRVTLQAHEATPATLKGLQDVLAAEHGRCAAQLILARDGSWTASFALPTPVAPSIALQERISVLLGRDDAVELL